MAKKSKLTATWSGPTSLNWLQLPEAREPLRRLVNFLAGDGWSIWRASGFVELGFPEALVFRSQRIHACGETRITRKDGPSPETVSGVRGLEFIADIAGLLGLRLDTSVSGHGTRCREFSKLLKSFLAHGTAT
jgi:hypothetical protein